MRSVRKAALMHGVRREILGDRIKDAIPKIEASQNMQRLSPGEEQVLVR